jgi:ABC-type lipoprotein export system ATPase subunit
MLPEPPTPPAFRVEGVHKHYRLTGHDIPVLQGVDLTVPTGEWTALTGPSGCGKTTLLHLLGALDQPSSGSIHCLGTAYSKLGRRARSLLRRRTIGYIFQAYNLLPELSALENVYLPGLQYGADKARVRSRALDLLERFGLGHRLQHRPQELSGGEQQRVAVARALVNDPAVILADEPTGNLDAEAGAGIIGILRELHREGRTIVMVTHDLALAGKADRVLRIREGAVEPCDREVA